MAFTPLETLQCKAAKSGGLSDDTVCTLVARAHQNQQWVVLDDLANMSPLSSSVESALFSVVAEEPAETFDRDVTARVLLSRLAGNPSLSVNQTEILTSKASDYLKSVWASQVPSSVLLHAMLDSLDKANHLVFAQGIVSNVNAPSALIVKVLLLLPQPSRLGLLKEHLLTLAESSGDLEDHWAGNSDKLKAHLVELFGVFEDKLEFAFFLLNQWRPTWPASVLYQSFAQGLGINDSLFWNENASERVLQQRVELVNDLLDLAMFEAVPDGWPVVLGLVEQTGRVVAGCNRSETAGLAKRLSENFLTPQFAGDVKASLAALGPKDTTVHLFEQLLGVQPSVRCPQTLVQELGLLKAVWDQTSLRDRKAVGQLDRFGTHITDFLLENESNPNKVGVLLLMSDVPHTLDAIKADACDTVVWLEQYCKRAATDTVQYDCDWVDTVLQDLFSALAVSDTNMSAFGQLSASRVAKWAEESADLRNASDWFRLLVGLMERKCGQSFEETWLVFNKMFTVWADGSVDHLIDMSKHVLELKS